MQLMLLTLPVLPAAACWCRPATAEAEASFALSDDGVVDYKE